MRFHHYPDPQAFFNSVKRVLRHGGRLIRQGYTASKQLASAIPLMDMHVPFGAEQMRQMNPKSTLYGRLY